MAEILLCVHNRGMTGVQAVDAVQPLMGDVIVAVANGWTWGKAELGQIVPGNPNGKHIFFRVIKLPNVSLANAQTLLAPELPVNPANPSPFLRYRGRYIDKAKIPPATMQSLLDNWNDDGRTNGFLTANFTAAQINSVVSTTDNPSTGYHARIPWP